MSNSPTGNGGTGGGTGGGTRSGTRSGALATRAAAATIVVTLAGACTTAGTPAGAPGGATAGATAAQDPAPVRTGLDVLVRDGFAQLQGRKVGLITNHTGITDDGTGIVDAFRAQDACELVALFSPEHGFAGVLDQADIDDSRHASGLVIHSLYGETRKPTAAMLRGVDTLVFDIQDIGTRFYTYVSTMRLSMEAAAEHGLRFVVLDRPNPIGGVAVAGPLLDAGSESFVGTHTIPVRHGMTAGELARMFAAERGIGCELRVVRVEGWRRAMLFDATGLYWVDPSPNMRNLNQALLYPGVGLLETTNLSVGRGTDTPFEVVGAPWIDGRRLAVRLNAAGLGGLRFVPVRFTPDASKFRDERCGGVHILITDRAAVAPLALGMALACALRDLFGDAWDHARYPRLLGSESTYTALVDGKSPAELGALWRRDLAGFERRRRPFLLYAAD